MHAYISVRYICCRFHFSLFWVLGFGIPFSATILELIRYDILLDSLLFVHFSPNKILSPVGNSYHTGSQVPVPSDRARVSTSRMLYDVQISMFFYIKKKLSDCHIAYQCNSTGELEQVECILNNFLTDEENFELLATAFRFEPRNIFNAKNLHWFKETLLFVIFEIVHPCD